MSSDGSGRLIATVYRNSLTALSIRVEPNWRDFVDTEDAPFVEEFLSELPIRNVEDPSSLWKQLIQINWGLIVTGIVHQSALVRQVANCANSTEPPQASH